MASQKEIALTQLHFDPENPRIPEKLRSSHSESKIIDYMVRYGNIIELMKSIGESGFSKAEPLLVVPMKKAKTEYIVVEGNRRLAALKLLADPGLTKIREKPIKDAAADARVKPDLIPVIEYKERIDVLEYLGYRHITGVKDWGPLEKARYLDQLYKMHVSRVGEANVYFVLAKMIGSRSDYVSKLHTSLKLFEYANEDAFFGSDIDEEEFDFSWLPTLLSYSDAIAFLNIKNENGFSLEDLNKEGYKQLFIWMFDPKKKIIGDSRQITNLCQILPNPVAYKKLEQGASINEALMYTQAPNNTFMELLDKAKSSLLQSKEMIEQLPSLPENSKYRIDEIEKLCRTVRGALKEVFLKDYESD